MAKKKNGVFHDMGNALSLLGRAHEEDTPAEDTPQQPDWKPVDTDGSQNQPQQPPADNNNPPTTPTQDQAPAPAPDNDNANQEPQTGMDRVRQAQQQNQQPANPADQADTAPEPVAPPTPEPAPAPAAVSTDPVPTYTANAGTKTTSPYHTWETNAVLNKEEEKDMQKLSFDESEQVKRQVYNLGQVTEHGRQPDVLRKVAENVLTVDDEFREMILKKYLAPSITASADFAKELTKLIEARKRPLVEVFFDRKDSAHQHMLGLKEAKARLAEFNAANEQYGFAAKMETLFVAELRVADQNGNPTNELATPEEGEEFKAERERKLIEAKKKAAKAKDGDKADDNQPTDQDGAKPAKGKKGKPSDSKPADDGTDAAA